MSSSILKECTAKLMAAIAAGANVDLSETSEHVLSKGQITECMRHIMQGDVPDATVASFLVALRAYHPATPTIDTLAACAETMLDFAVPCNPDLKRHSSNNSNSSATAPQPPVLVDIVGTGGDGRDAFNVSTASGLVMAACGLPVAKHGNRSSSGNVGSADFLEGLGAHLNLSGKQIEHCIERCGFAFLFAQQFHPAMKHVAAIRKQLGIRTIFNLLGPLTNPARPSHKVIGVSDPRLGPVFAALLRTDGTRRALVVHSTDGLDEISPSAPTLVWEVNQDDGGGIRHYTIEPQADFGIEPCDLDLVCGGSVRDRVAAFSAALDGDTTSPIARFIILNAAAGIYVAGKAASLMDAAGVVRKALTSGDAKQLVQDYVALTLEQQESHGGEQDQQGKEQGKEQQQHQEQLQHQDQQQQHQESPGQTQPRLDQDCTYVTEGGIEVTRTCSAVDEVETHVRALASVLDTHLGLLMCSDYEQPGRYTKWVTGFSDPPLMLVTRQRNFTITALNTRGEILLPAIARHLELDTECIASISATRDVVTGCVRAPHRRFSEEERSRQPSVFSVVRRLLALFRSDSDCTLGLYGAFGYDLAFQFEDTALTLERPGNQRDMVLFLPDRILRYDVATQRGHVYSYDFGVDGASTRGLERYGPQFAYRSADAAASSHPPPSTGSGNSNSSSSSNSNSSSSSNSGGFMPGPNYTKSTGRRGPGSSSSGGGGDGDDVIVCDHEPGEYAKKVMLAKEKFKVGDLFEAVLSQSFHAPCTSRPSRLFHRLRRRNPAPYAFIVSLGSKEYLVGASPEMYVRAEQQQQQQQQRGGEDDQQRSRRVRIETCPISGTIRRGKDPMEDSRNVVALLSSKKEEAELTMCTDVDRNDKSRICEPGSVRLLARRQIEMYSKLIHTVDHVEGVLRPGYDALDAFLCHTWAVTVTGAPKTWAMQFVEDTEASARRWYAGAVGMIYFNGDMNTGLTLRTIHIEDGVACVRAGATLLWDSDPHAEEEETRLKASAFLDALLHSHANTKTNAKTKAKAEEKERGEMLVGEGDGHDDMWEAEPTVNSAGGHENDHDLSDDDDDFDDSDDGTVSRFRFSSRSPDLFTHGHGMKVVVIDHQDSFVHTLSNYLRQTGAEVVTFRAGVDPGVLEQEKPDAVLMSPGPGNPRDFNTSSTLSHLLLSDIPVFGVCLGLQAMVEHFGGTLDVLPEPLHGKPSTVNVVAGNSAVFAGLPDSLVVARYHSLYARLEAVPACLAVTAISEDGVVMAVEHKTLPLAAVQFHPESILTGREHGVHILDNALQWFTHVRNTRVSHPPTPSRTPGRVTSTI